MSCVAPLRLLSVLAFSAGLASAAMAEPRTVATNYQVELTDICRTGLVAWLPMPPKNGCGQVQTPQVKIFGTDEKLKFEGSVTDALTWVDQSMPPRAIAQTVLVRDWATEARITGLQSGKPAAPVAVFYVNGMCPPCIRAFETFKAKALPKLGAHAEVRVVRIGEVFPD